jgi:hypothetical protein
VPPPPTAAASSGDLGALGSVPSSNAFDAVPSANEDAGAVGQDMMGGAPVDGAPPAAAYTSPASSAEWTAEPEPLASTVSGAAEAASNTLQVAVAPGPGNMQLALSPAAQAAMERERRAAAAAAERERFLAEVRAKWRERNDQELAARQEHEANENRNVVEEAEAERQLFYNQRTKAIEATKNTHRQEQQRDAAISRGGSGTVWEKMAAIVEQAELGKSKTDLTKFKSLLTRLKTQPPGSAAVKA